MKLLMIIGAILGFCLGLTLGYVGRADWPSMLWHSCAAAAVLGILMRWWGQAWVRNLQLALEERRATEAPARSQSPPTKALKS